jgi:BirA family biotin operon repressor/biotin-[acetyl-CoA-carboxylase] ligase
MTSLDGHDAAALATLLGAPRVALFDVLGSTMDEAHALAVRGAPAGTVVVALEQTAGRGRGGRRWESSPGAGLWFSLVERPGSTSGLDVLSLRLGLRLAPVLDRFASGAVRLKWPNDFLLDDAKLGGILIEARWRDTTLDWVAIGVGINLLPPANVPSATGLGARTTRSALLAALFPAARSAAAVTGSLTAEEYAQYASRDHAWGRRVSEPAPGLARGITPDGSLVIETDAGLAYFRAGSLVYAGDSE